MNIDPTSATRRPWFAWVALVLTGSIAVGLLFFLRPSETKVPGVEVVASERGAFPVGLGRDELIRRVEEARIRTSQLAPSSRVETSLPGADLQNEILVVDDHGVPIPGAEIRALGKTVVYRMFEYSAGIQPMGDALCTSKSSGIAILQAPGRVRQFVASRSGFEPAFFTWDPSSERPTLVTLGQLRGHSIRLVDTDGAAIPFARILVDLSDWGWGSARAGSYFDLGSTDSSGQLVLAQGTRSGLGLIVAEGYCPYPFDLEEVTLAEGDTTYILPRASAVPGVLMGGGSDLPVYVSAELLADKQQPMVLVPVGPSNDFEYPALTDGVDWTLTPCVMGFGGPEAIGPSVTVRPPTVQVELSTSAGVSLHLRAIDPSGKPVLANVCLSLLGDQFLARVDTHSHVIQADGSIYWPSLPFPSSQLSGGSRSSLWVVADGYVPENAGIHELNPGSKLQLLDVVLTPGAGWTVRVCNALDNHPIKNARVRYIPHAGFSAGREGNPWLQAVTTNERGEAQLLAPEGESGVLEVSADGWRQRTLPVHGDDWSGLKVELERPSGVLLRCLSLEGKPAPGASIQWRSLSSSIARGKKWHNEFAAKDGYARFDVPPGSVEIRHSPRSIRGSGLGMGVLIELSGMDDREALISGQATDPSQLTGIAPGEVRSVTIQVAMFSSIEVLVLTDGLPTPRVRVVGIPGSELDVVLNDIWGTFDLPRGVTNEEGRCTLEGLPRGLMTIAAIDPTSGIVSHMVIRVLRSLEVPVFLMTRSRVVTALVVDSDGEPLAGLPVKLKQLSTQHGVRSPDRLRISPSGTRTIQGAPNRHAEAITDSEGHATFLGIPCQARFQLSCGAPDRFPLLGSSPVGIGDQNLEVRMRDGSGSAIDLELRNINGTPQADRSVVLQWIDQDGNKKRAVEYTGAHGVVRYPSLDPGSYTLVVETGQALQIDLLEGYHHSQILILR